MTDLEQRDTLQLAAIRRVRLDVQEIATGVEGTRLPEGELREMARLLFVYEKLLRDATPIRKARTANAEPNAPEAKETK